MKNRKTSSNTIWLGLLILAVSSVLLCWFMEKLNLQRNQNIKKQDWQDYILPLLVSSGFTGELVKFIFSQAAFETGNFSSDILKENNNLFGMKLPRVRKTLATGENKGHATFASIEDCIKDFTLYHKSLGYLSAYPSLDSYIKALTEKKYFEANPQTYLNGVRHFYNLYFSGK